MLDLFESYRTGSLLSSLSFASTLRSFHGCRTEQACARARSLPPDGGRGRDRGGGGGRGADEHLRGRRPPRPRHVRPRRRVAADAARCRARRPAHGGGDTPARGHEDGRTPARDRLRDPEAAHVRRLHGAVRGDRSRRVEAAPLRPLRHVDDTRRARCRRGGGAGRRGRDRPGARGARRVVGQARALPETCCRWTATW